MENKNNNDYVVTLCADNIDIADQVFSIPFKQYRDISIFIKLTEMGSKEAGLIKPAIIIVGPTGIETEVSRRNNWEFTQDQFDRITA